VVAHDLRTGDELWTADGEVDGELWVEDGLVLWIDADGVLQAVDAQSGEPQWTNEAATARPQGQRDVLGDLERPVPDDGVVLVADDGVLLGLDADDGAERWSAGPWDQADGEAFVLDGTVVALLSDGAFERHVVGLDPGGGEERWRVRARGVTVPAGSPGHVNLGVAVVELATGTVTRTPDVARIVAASGDLVLVQTEEGLEGLVALEPGSGAQRWSLDGEFGVATIVGDTVVASNLDGDLVGLSADEGEPRWALESGIATPGLVPTGSGVVVYYETEIVFVR
jgi:eukaryotic-like serine/threonine-protein kinase